MNDHKGIFIKFLVLLLLCMEYCNMQSVTGGGDIGEVRCMEREREALLRFKKGLIDEYGVLSSWGSGDNSKECCKWKGVRCSNTTGHVIGLLLNGFELSASPYRPLRGKISSALLELQHLNNLDLSNNDFGGDRIPEFIGSIKNLELLNLMEANFSGIVPPQLGNLTNLRTLYLSFNLLRSENLNWLSGLSLLTDLDLCGSNISDTNWLQQILRLRSLQALFLLDAMLVDVTSRAGLFVNSSSTSLTFLELSQNELTSSTFEWLFNISTSLVGIYLSDNQLDGPIPDAFGRLIFLEELDLSGNALGGHLEELFGNLSTKGRLPLESHMDLSNNQLTGSVPKLRAFSALKKLYLGRNKFTGSVPISLGQLSKLEVLDVSLNSLEGTITEADLIKLDFINLKLLDLSFNSLTVQISPDWIPPFQLDFINLAGCDIGPRFPSWIQTQNKLRWLDLSYNGISDEVPKWLWSLSLALQYLNLSHNQISGTIPDLSSKSIQVIDVSSNKFAGPVPSFHPNTTIFQLSKNMFSGSISSICSIRQFYSLELLDLSNNQLEGELPNCWDNITNLKVLNLANNHLSGEIPRALGSLRILMALHLHNNNLTGKLPSTLKNCEDLKLIDIGGNKLTGNIPAWIGASYTFVVYLSFRDNRFYGSIPPEICSLIKIQMLDLSMNNISGKIPPCIHKFGSLVEKNTTITAETAVHLYVIAVFEDFSFTNFPRDYIYYALVQWKGEYLEYRKTLGLLKLIDLSSNRLVGDIPKAFSSLRGLISLNLSRNSLTGNIDPNIGQMEMLECLDLSRNQLSGEIPIGLAQLHFLNVLDLANNNLSGKIPSGTQLQSFNASSYAGNTKLCGPPLTLCPGDGLVPSLTNQEEHIKEKDDGSVTLSFMQEFCMSMALGFILGFWGVVGPLLLKRSWRSAYFNFLDKIGDWLYVTTTIFLRKFRRR